MWKGGGGGGGTKWLGKGGQAFPYNKGRSRNTFSHAEVGVGTGFGELLTGSLNFFAMLKGRGAKCSHL